MFALTRALMELLGIRNYSAPSDDGKDATVNAAGISGGGDVAGNADAAETGGPRNLNPRPRWKIFIFLAICFASVYSLQIYNYDSNVGRCMSQIGAHSPDSWLNIDRLPYNSAIVIFHNYHNSIITRIFSNSISVLFISNIVFIFYCFKKFNLVRFAFIIFLIAEMSAFFWFALGANCDLQLAHTAIADVFKQHLAPGSVGGTNSVGFKPNTAVVLVAFHYDESQRGCIPFVITDPKHELVVPEGAEYPKSFWPSNFADFLTFEKIDVDGEPELGGFGDQYVSSLKKMDDQTYSLLNCYH